MGIADLYVVPIGGGEPRRLSNWNAIIDGLSWTPDGREIVYSVDEPTASRLWRIPAFGATPSRGLPIADIPTAARYPSISRAMPGRPARLAFQTIARDVDLHLIDLGARLVNDTLESQPFSNSTRMEGSARFSPNGNRIAFASLRAGDSEVWVAERDGSGLQQVTSLGAAGVMLGEWSPDGTTIAFEAAVSGNTDVYLVGADGGHLRRLTEEASIDGVPSWSRDGQWIYFASTRGGVNPDTWRVSPNGGEAIRMTRNGGFQPQESSDGNYLFYLDRSPAGWRSRYREADAPTTRWRTRGTGVRRVRPFLWSVTDTGIVFVTREATSMRSTYTGSATSVLPVWAGLDFGYRGSTRT